MAMEVGPSAEHRLEAAAPTLETIQQLLERALSTTTEQKGDTDSRGTRLRGTTSTAELAALKWKAKSDQAITIYLLQPRSIKT